jgi:hypothetical protein
MPLEDLEATSAGGGDFAVPPAGNHYGRLVTIVELGSQTRERGDKSSTHKEIYMCWEFPELTDAGTVAAFHLIGKSFTYSFHVKSSLRQLVETWRGKTFADGEKFNITKLLGLACVISVKHANSSQNRTYASIGSVAAPPKGSPVPAANRKPAVWEIATGNLADLDDLPFAYGSKVADLVAASPEWKARQGAKAAPGTNGTSNGTHKPAEPAAATPAQESEPAF